MKTRWMYYAGLLLVGLTVQVWGQCGSLCGSLCESSSGSWCGGLCSLCGDSGTCVEETSTSCAYTSSYESCPARCDGSSAASDYGFDYSCSRDSRARDGGTWCSDGSSYCDREMTCGKSRCSDGSSDFDRGATCSRSRYCDGSSSIDRSTTYCRSGSCDGSSDVGYRAARSGTLWYDVRRDASPDRASCFPVATTCKRCLMECNGDWVVINCPD
jgi:hypothetical protein